MRGIALGVVFGCLLVDVASRATRAPRDGASTALDAVRAVPVFARALERALPVSTLPALATSPLTIVDGDAWLEVRPEGLAPVAARSIDGAAVMLDAATDTDVIALATEHGLEELRVLRSKSAPSIARYRIHASPAIAALRVHEGRVEAIDHAGSVRITSERMFAVDARGVRRDLTLTLDDGALVAALDTRDLETPIVVDPSWASVGSMLRARYFDLGSDIASGLALLPSGKVLVGGQHDGSAVQSFAEVFDPTAGTWSAVGSISGPRHARLTALKNGKVMIAGGLIAASDCTYTNAVELFDPASNTWSAVASMAVRRDSSASVTLLNDGRVLVVGGGNTCGGNLSSVELYDPVANTWTTKAPTSVLRRGHIAALIPGGTSGKLLVAGGSDSPTTGEVYDPATNTWTGTSATVTAGLWGYTNATTLPDGRVLAAGGYAASVGPLSSAQIYDPSTNAWTAAAPLAGKRHRHASVLVGGKVLVLGGADATPLSTAELYDPATNTWSSLPNMSTARLAPAAIALSATKVLVVGGLSPAKSTAEVLTLDTLANGATCGSSSECTSGDCVDGVCCNSACAGQCQACDVSGSVGTCTTLTSGAPHGARTACSGTGLCQGTCNGTSATACGYPGSTVTCAAASCSDGTSAIAASTCNGAGACVAPAPMSCAPGTCVSGACVIPDAGPDVADTAMPDTATMPDTFVPDTFVPDTFVPDTFVPDTFVPDTFVEDTSAADTFVPDTAVPDTAMGDTAVAIDSATDSAVVDGNPIPSIGCDCVVAPAGESDPRIAAIVAALVGLALARRRGVTSATSATRANARGDGRNGYFGARE